MGAMLRLLPMEYFRMIPGFCSALVAPERAMPDGVYILRLFRLPASLTTSNQLGSNPDQADVNDAQVPVFAWFGSDRPSGRRSHVRDVATDVPITRPSGLLHLDLCPLGQGSPLLILALFRTDFEPEVDRFRCGVRPISSRR